MNPTLAELVSKAIDDRTETVAWEIAMRNDHNIRFGGDGREAFEPGTWVMAQAQVAGELAEYLNTGLNQFREKKETR